MGVDALHGEVSIYCSVCCYFEYTQTIAFTFCTTSFICKPTLVAHKSCGQSYAVLLLEKTAVRIIISQKSSYLSDSAPLFAEKLAEELKINGLVY